MTHYEKIKSMSIEEMAIFIPCPYEYIDNIPYFSSMECIEVISCKECCKQWLESEVEVIGNITDNPELLKESEESGNL